MGLVYKIIIYRNIILVGQNITPGGVSCYYHRSSGGGSVVLVSPGWWS